MYGGRRRRTVSPFQRFEFLVFLVPLCFFLLAFLVLSMTLMPAPTHPSAVRHGRSSRAPLSSSTARSLPTSFLCGHPMHGVSSALWPVYCVGAGGWLCIHSREWLDSAAVNDDYCDCADGSDEVGTSACAGRERSEVRFTCRTTQNNSLPLSRVNDGICDCCDGSHNTPTQQHRRRSSSQPAINPLIRSMCACDMRVCVWWCGCVCGRAGAMSGTTAVASTAARPLC